MVCDTGWSFSTIETTESAIAIKTGTLPDALSTQELVSCDDNDDGCDGGTFDNAWLFVKENGLVTEAQYPYVSGTDDSSRSCIKSKTENPFLETISSVSDIPPNRADLLKNAVAKNGPVSAAIDASAMSFRFYTSGIYDKTPSTISLDHAIGIVGYTKDAWILRNSWDTTWGDQGYMLLSRTAGDERGALGVTTNAAFVNL